MAWYAKPSGGYAKESDEAKANMIETYNQLYPLGWTIEAISACLGNSAHEGAFNPWRWQSDRVTRTGGCGMFGFTPASRYLDNYAEHMNMSTSSVTAGARADEGAVQVRIMSDGTWGWVSSCWRTYWDKVQYSSLYNYSRQVVARWGSNGRVTMNQFKQVTSVRDATFIFYACFEGPASASHFEQRVTSANYIYEYLSGSPVPPEPPIPEEDDGLIPFAYMLKLWR